MTRQLRIFWWGILIYGVSFFLIAVQFLGMGFWSPWFGFLAAFYSVSLPWENNGWIVTHWGPFHNYFQWAALVISGWINPVFIVTAFLDLSGQYARTVAVLRIVLLAMIPFCWVFFAFAFMIPREGHFAWVAGMLMALFSKEIDGRRARRDVFS